ncbi:MAG: acyl-CoA dehydrogenase family protein [Acidimicrobiales bacterium]|jgi:alkylation response protein AidB-like acyl-CoA dehydrogenase|nr:acyl-CoA dehydrogenase family protein [Acidimicrobiales bacterium]
MTIAADVDVDLLGRARDLASLIDGDAVLGEQTTTLTPAVVQALRDAELFWIQVPRELGGAEADIATALAVYEELSRADGSTGWSLMANATSLCFAALYPDDAAVDVMFGGDARPITAGMFGPLGSAVATDGGYRVSGHYQFGSGCGHADWFAAGVMEQVDGEPAVTELGLPAMRVVFLPADQVEVRGNWDVMGLAGTGSYDYVVEDRYVAEAFTFPLLENVQRRGGRVFGIGLFGITAAGHAGFALGVGRRALDEVLAIAKAKQRLGAEPIAEQQLFLHDFAMHDAAVRASRAYVFESFVEAEAAAIADGMPSIEQSQRMRQATTWATRVAAQAADFAYTWAGSTGLRNGSAVQRCFRDIHAGTQHLYVDNNTLTGYTQTLLAQT